MSRLALAPAHTDSVAVDALDVLAAALLPRLRGLLAETRAADDLLDVARAVPTSRRAVYAACRRGAIPGAVRVARRWLAPRRGIEQWLRASGPIAVPDAGEVDDLEDLRVSLSRPEPRRSRRRTG